MTPEELAEALEIARNTTEEAVYSRRVLARAVLWMSETHKRLRPPGGPYERTCPRCSGAFLVRFKSSDRVFCPPCSPAARRERGQALPRGRRKPPMRLNLI